MFTILLKFGLYLLFTPSESFDLVSVAYELFTGNDFLLWAKGAFILFLRPRGDMSRLIPDGEFES